MYLDKNKTRIEILDIYNMRRKHVFGLLLARLESNKHLGTSTKYGPEISTG